MVKNRNLLTLTLLAAAEFLINGLTISCLWNWFISPLGPMNIDIRHAIGIAIFAKVLLGNWGEELGPDSYEIVRAFVLPLAFTMAGFVIQL